MTSRQTKYYILFLTISLTGLLILISAKPEAKSTLEIKIADCRYQGEYASVFVQHIFVFKGGKKIKDLTPQGLRTQTIKGLEKGTYFLEYQSIFNTTEKIKVVIAENKNYSIDLCINNMDHSKAKHKPIIDQLKENENYKIRLFSRGCFHSTKDSIIISRSGGMYNLKWGLKTKTLDDSDLETIRHFEIEMTYLMDCCCTTTDSYVISHNGKEHSYSDGTCHWRGGHYLKRGIFKEE